MNHSPSNPSDPYLWLEDIESEEALSWVRARNARTEVAFCDAAFEADRAQIYEISTRPDIIPYITRRRGPVYNLWQDAAQVPGVVRRITPEA